MKHILTFILTIGCISANTQEIKIWSRLEQAKSLVLAAEEIALGNYSFRKTIENQVDLDSLIRELFSPEAAIVAGGRKDMLSVSTVGAIRRTKVSEDAIDIASIIKPGMCVYDLVWKRGDSELRSVAITNGDDIVYDNIGSRLLFFEGSWSDARENNEALGKKGDYESYAEKLITIFVSGPFVSSAYIFINCGAMYTDNIIWQPLKPKMVISSWTPENARRWAFTPDVTELAGGRTCSDFAISWVYEFCSKDYYAAIDGTNYLIPGAKYYNNGILKISADDITYTEKGEGTGVTGIISHALN